MIICGSEEITLGALEALQSGGWQAGRDFCLVGADAEDAVQTGSLTITVVHDWEELASKTFSTIQSLQNGETVEKEYYVNLKTVSTEAE